MARFFTLFLLFGWSWHSALAENDDFEFGVEQEVSSAWDRLTIAPLIDLLKGRPAKEYDLVSILAGRSYLRLLKKRSQEFVDPPVIHGTRIYYTDHDWGFSVTPDYGTVEMVFEPMTLAMYRDLEPRLERDLWETAAQRRLHPGEYFSAGHVHIGIKNFGHDSTLFLNYIIDFANHSELHFGVLGFDPINALPPLQNERDKSIFRDVLRDFDAGRISTISEIQERLHVLPGFGKPRAGLQGALNLKTKFPTIEFRALRSHRSAKHLGAFLEMQAQRIAYLRTKKGRIPYEEPTVTVDRDELTRRFHRYVEEMEGKREWFELLLPQGWSKKVRKALEPRTTGTRNSSFLGRCYLLLKAIAN